MLALRRGGGVIGSTQLPQRKQRSPRWRYPSKMLILTVLSHSLAGVWFRRLQVSEETLYYQDAVTIINPSGCAKRQANLIITIYMPDAE